MVAWSCVFLVLSLKMENEKVFWLFVQFFCRSFFGRISQQIVSLKKKPPKLTPCGKNAKQVVIGIAIFWKVRHVASHSPILFVE